MVGVFRKVTESDFAYMVVRTNYIYLIFCYMSSQRRVSRPQKGNHNPQIEEQTM